MNAIRLACLLLLITSTVAADDFPEIVNSQKAGEHPPSPEEAAKMIKVPEGFQVTLFAGEPDVAQPIDMEFDDRGRIWVAECYSYNGRNFEGEHRDRIVILEDVDNDGRHDNRKVFWDEGIALTSLCYGFGGVYVLNKGTLSHIADRDGDDVPDGEPVVLLDGFDYGPIGHNIASGLMWGPDGWLYGRHGIQANSYVGKPGDAASKRTAMNVGIWRYHPQREKFEVVCSGTTNPWGLDYDENGQFFFTNNVIGHLWHVIPGAHYQRMYGEDFNPHLYALIEQTADHYHWDHSKSWTDSREGANGADELGGGHSHCGGMIYLGDNWPDEYRGGMFMCNTHGRRINHDRLVRQGSSYVGKHAPDFMFANQPWFRGVELMYGPDGGVYVSDWSDLGECHDHDGVHRTSGRIYKITYGDVSGKERADRGDISKLSNVELLDLHTHANQWYVRRARRVLIERSVGSDDFDGGLREYMKQVKEEPGGVELWWTVWAASIVSPDAFVERVERGVRNSHEHRFITLIRLVVERETTDRILTIFENLAANSDSGLVRLYIASALQKIPLESRWPIAKGLASHEADAQDHHLRLMLWYGIEPAVAAHPQQAIEFLKTCKWPLLQQYVARRLMYEVEEHPEKVVPLYELLKQETDTAFRREVLTGMVTALAGRKQVAAPKGWDALHKDLATTSDPIIRRYAQELAVVHGDGRAIDDLRAVVADRSKAPDQRAAALDVLITARPDDLAPLLLKVLNERAIMRTAIRGLAYYDEPRAPGAIFGKYRHLKQDGRNQAIATLSSRPLYAKALLDAVENGTVDVKDISAFHARQMFSLDDAEVTARLTKLWGSLRSTPTERREQIESFREKYSADILAKADLAHGRALFAKSCANCHTLYGVGENIGPDLTGSGRHNLDYLLENILDPSALVATQFRMSALRLASGKVVNGVIVQETDQVLTVQTEKEKLAIDRDEVDEIKLSSLSLMPDGLLKNLSDDDIRDLFGYLQSKSQVPLPSDDE